MGLMDKFKNLFTDEEIIEEEETEPIEIKEVKKEDEVQKLPTFMREKIEKEEKQGVPELDVKRELKLESTLEHELEPSLKVEDKNSFKFPIDFSDSDFVETRSRQSLHQRKLEESKQNVSSSVHEISRKERNIKTEPKVADLYKDKKQEEKEEHEKKFRATPIISPIYGILDQNYTSDDMTKVEGEALDEKRHSKNVDFDSVRKKAYGSLSEEIKENLMCENCEYLKEVKECKKEKLNYQENDHSADLLYDVLEEDTSDNDVRDITLDEATENYYDYGVEYEKNNDSYALDSKGASNLYHEDEVKIVNHEKEKNAKDTKITKEIPPVKSSINLLSTLKKSMGEQVETSVPKKEEKLELTDDLFNLIDSMYDERNERDD